MTHRHTGLIGHHDDFQAEAIELADGTRHTLSETELIGGKGGFENPHLLVKEDFVDDTVSIQEDGPLLGSAR